MSDTDHYYIPRHDWEALKEELQQVGWISDELDNALTRQTRFTDRQTYRQITEEERPVPFNTKASDYAHDLNGLLNEWILRVCTARNIKWPGYMRTPKAGHWLDNHHIYLALTEGAETFPDDLKATMKACRRLVDRPPGTVYAGPCPRNDTWCGDLYARVGAKTVKCQHCENTWDVTELREYMMEEARLTIGTAAELGSILPWFMDAPIDRKRITYLARRKMITKRPSSDGHDRFQLGEVVDAHNLLIGRKHGA